MHSLDGDYGLWLVGQDVPERQEPSDCDEDGNLPS